MSELERRLRAAGPHYAFPEVPDLAGAARARLIRQRARPRLRLRVAAAVALAALASALGLSPGARSALTDLLELVPGISIERVPQLPEAYFTQEPSYGSEVSFEEAEQRFGRPLRLPAGIGEPDRLYWLRHPPGDMITAIYGARATGARLVFSQWKTGGPSLFTKTLSFQTTAEGVRVGDEEGLWISGGPHLVWFHSSEAPDSPTHYAHQGALSGNVLAWRDGDVIYRLEADLDKERGLGLARSLDAGG